MTNPAETHAEEEIPISVIRPRFAVEIRHSIEEVVDKITSGLKNQNLVRGKIDHHHILLFINDTDRHYWSPELSITFDEMEDGNVIRGVFGPRPAVWTMFVFFYSAIGFASLVVLMVAMSYYSLGKSLEILWLLPVLIIIFLSLYLVAYSGKKMGSDQLHILHEFVEATTGIKI